MIWIWFFIFFVSLTGVKWSASCFFLRLKLSSWAPRQISLWFRSGRQTFEFHLRYAIIHRKFSGLLPLRIDSDLHAGGLSVSHIVDN